MAKKKGSYVDGYVLPIPKNKIAAYRKMATLGSKIWKEHGALEYRECIGDDLNTKWGITFPKRTKLKASETLIFSWIVFESKSHRDRVNKKVMSDPRLAKMMDAKNMPFDDKRMSYGGFKILVEF